MQGSNSPLDAAESLDAMLCMILVQKLFSNSEKFEELQKNIFFTEFLKKTASFVISSQDRLRFERALLKENLDDLQEKMYLCERLTEYCEVHRYAPTFLDSPIKVIAE